MPNHVTSILKLSGDQKSIDSLVEEFSTFHPETQHVTYDNRKTFKNSEGEFGWLKEETNIFTRRGGDPVNGVPKGFKPHMQKSFLRFPDFQKIAPMPPEVKESINIAGSNPTWYRWSIDNWGTKWNSYSFEKIGKNEYKFETAWSSVVEMVKKMYEKYPFLEIEYTWADEDSGQNCGNILFSNGFAKKNIPEGGSKEAFEIVFSVDPSLKEIFKFCKKSDTYEYVDEE